MSLVSVKVSLYRDGGGTAWGFRLQGGTDVQLPLTVQRVVFGSPADGELHPGDIITQIGNKDATRLTHHQAHNTIKSAGNNLSLTVQRPGRYVSQVHNSNSHAYSYGIPNLGRSDFNGDYRRFVPQPPQNFPSALNSDVQTEKDFERQCIVGQPHRTFPLITPSVKVKHDVPTGSYLRYCNDPFTRNRPEPSMKAKVQESIMNAAGWSAGSSPARSGTPEVVGNVGPNSHIVHRQYNSPIHLYSPQNIADTIAGQTGVTPTLGDFIKEAIVEIASPIDDSTLKRGPGDIRLYDINKSPTYQAICEKEWRSVKKTSNAVSEHNPVQNKTKVRSPIPPSTQHHHHDYYNHMGIPKDKILQSKSFELINTVLAGETDF